MRRVGKTSLVRWLSSHTPSIFIDLQVVSGDLGRLGQMMNRELRRKQERWPWLISSNNDSDPFVTLERIDEAATRVGSTVYVLFDEAEGLTDFAEDALKQLKHFIWGISQATCAVIASAKNLTELDDKCRQWKTSPFLNNFPPSVFLGCLNVEESNALVLQSQSPTPIQADSSLCDSIRFHTGNHPYLIQWLCHRLWQQDDSLRPLTDDDCEPDLSLARRFAMDFDYLSASERQILQIVATQGCVTRTNLAIRVGIPYLADYLNGMTRLGYLRHAQDEYTVGNTYLDRWLKTSAPWEATSGISDESTLAMYRKSHTETPLLEQTRQVRQTIIEHFDEEELRSLSFDIGIDYEGLPGQGKNGKARELVAHCVRHKLWRELIEVCQRLRPELEW
jgi:hypothetical protein